MSQGPALVTGGTGFLGRRLVERLLASGRKVVTLSRSPAPDLSARGVTCLAADLDQTAAVRQACAGVETVFHLGAKVGVWGRYDDFYRTNVLGTRAILAGCRDHGVPTLVYTSSPSVVYHGGDLAGADESLPLTSACPSPYPLTKALAEAEVIAADSPGLRTIALRPHLIWGAGDPHLIPRLLRAARAGRLRIVGTGKNRVDLVQVENAVDAHLLAEEALRRPGTASHSVPGGRAYFITNGEPVVLWDWINHLLEEVGERPLVRRMSLRSALALGAACEALWGVLPLPSEPPMTRFIAKELAQDHWFDLGAARRDLGYVPRVSMAQGLIELVAALKAAGPPSAAGRPQRG